MYGVILGQDIPFPGGCPVPDACANLASGDCPIEAGEEFVWNMEMPIDSWFPGVSYLLLSSKDTQMRSPSRPKIQIF